MTDSSLNEPNTFLRWLQHSNAIMLTLLGIVLYTIFYLPAAYFYGKLGTSPGEVGLTYLTVLSQTPLGILITIFAFLLVSLYTVGAAVILVEAACLMRIGITFFFNPQLLLDDFRLDYEQFKKKLDIGKKVWVGRDPWHEFERALRRRRELMMLDSKTRADLAELHRYRKITRRWVTSILPLGNLSPSWALPRRRYPLAIVVSVILTILTMLYFANSQADQVLKGAGYTGAQVGLLDYRAEKVTVISTASTANDDLKPLLGKTVFLLGQTSQYIVCYEPSIHRTLRIPIGSVTVSGHP
jgi:uncharacterized membrane protein (DUF485 family)